VPRRAPRLPDGPPQIAFSFDLDYQADTDALPRLVRLCDDLGVSATMFCIGRLVEADPGPYRAAAEAGHEIANHTWSHPDNPVLNPDREFWDLDADAMADEIGRAQDMLERATGQRPCGFRSPHFKDAFPLRAALARFPEITYLSSALATRCPVPTPFFPARREAYGRHSLAYPATAAAPGDPLMIPLTACPGVRWSPFSSYLSIRRPANRSKGAGLHDLAGFARLWARMLEAERKRRFVSVYFDPLDVMRDAETEAVFRGMLVHALAQGWTLAPLRAVAARWRPVAPP
jgi:peptidoglycan/xylan/chitin deacetylase (PgdA/CDA1 family)